MKRYHQERAYLLGETGSFPYPSQRPRADEIGPSDYAAAKGIPSNLLGPIAGSCLIWRGALDAVGYGILNVNGQRELAHRQIYRQTRGNIPDDQSILHMCNRRSCVQPAHLYAGSQGENNRDRELRYGGHHEKLLPLVLQTINGWRAAGYPVPNPTYDPALLGDEPLAEAQRVADENDQWYARAAEAAQYTRPAPPQARMMPGLEPPTPGHECRFTIPAGHTKLCEVCFEPVGGFPRPELDLGGPTTS